MDHDTVITSEWGTPSMIENGLNPEDLLGRKFGHHLNFWSMSQRTITQRVDLGDQHQMVLELRPAHDPAKTWGSATRSGLHNCWRTRWRRAGTGPAAGLRARNSMKLP